MPASTPWESELILRVGDVQLETPRAALVQLDLEGKRLHFKAGQAVMLGLQGEPQRKPYSIACSPEDASATGRLDLLVGLDARGTFGGHLAGMKRGSLVEAAGPSGRFVLPARASAHQLVFIAGGVGIAPIRAMIGSALAMKRRRGIALIYSARTPDDFAFNGEFRRMARRGELVFRQTVTRGLGPAWRGRRGRINRDLIARLVETPASALCFVCGPDGLAADVPIMLRELGVADAHIRYERY
jgi:ferredoxin-NADP reductase